MRQPNPGPKVSGTDGRMTLEDVSPEERPDAIYVFERAFDRWPPFPVSDGPAGFLDWVLTEGAHFRGRCRTIRYDGELVGASMRVERDALVEGVIRPARQGMYGAMLPERQGQGLARARRELEQQRGDPAHLSWGFTQVAQLDHLRPFFADQIPIVDRLMVYVRITDALNAAAEGQSLLRRRAGYIGLRLLGGLRRRGAPDATGLRVTPVDSFTDEVFAPFWADASSAFDFIAVRNAEYVNWRFGDPRAGRFLLHAAWDGDRLVGYTAVRVGTPRAVVAELLTLRDRPEVARALLDAATDAARAAGSDSVEVWLPQRHPHASTAQRAGFVALRGRSEELTRKFHISARAADISEFAGLERPDARLHLVAADSDLV